MTDLKEAKRMINILKSETKRLLEENETMREAVKQAELMRCQHTPTREERWQKEPMGVRREMDINIKLLLRPCMVANRKGGKERRAFFHCWEQWSNVIGESPLLGGHKGGQVSEIYGIVEFEDGTVQSVYPQLIRFLDSPFGEYAWEPEGAE